MIRFTILKINVMEKINEIKLPEGVDSISVTQHDDKIVIEFIPKEAKFKRGDILKLISIATPVLTVIFDKVTSTTTFDSIYHNGESSNHGWCLGLYRHATKEEKQEFFDELEADGKRWNADKKCIEDIPKRKFKAGDKVTLKSRCISKTGLEYFPLFDRYIGERLEVVSYSKNGYVQCNNYFYFHEDWLEPWSEEPKKGDLAIFWDNGYSNHLIRLYHGKSHSGNMHSDNFRTAWDNAVKWDGTKEQFEKILRGEI